jgi:oxalate decarboxylase/phosphoglucose isomerase-like protein (cupin superfamily)
VPEHESKPGILECSDIGRERFHEEIVKASRPAVFRGLVADWPVVRAGGSQQALSAYLRRFERGQSIGAMFGSPKIKGRFFYNEDLTGFNFKRESVKISGALDFLLAAAEEERPPSLAIQSVQVRQNLPGFEAENVLPLLDNVEPRVWIGNAVTVAAHQDTSENIACCVAGRRRFTLFPPDQDANLYLGPFELTPAGTRISLVDFDAPDLARFPRFPEALAAAITVDLEPGDALYIPYMWWHHVRSIERVNMLVNYWWTPPMQEATRPSEAFLHAMLSIHSLPKAHRDAWRILFDRYVFEADEPSATHIPAERRGMMGTLDDKAAAELRATLARALSRS